MFNFEIRAQSKPSNLAIPRCIGCTQRTVTKKHQANSNLISTHEAEAICLTCIDFRFVDYEENFMRYTKKLNNKYDQFVLAGSSLVSEPSSPAWPYDWKSVLNQHIQLSKNLHDIKEIVIIDHMDCGAYKAYYGDAYKNADNASRIAFHKGNLDQLGTQIRSIPAFNGLKYFGYLMKTNGKPILLSEM